MIRIIIYLVIICAELMIFERSFYSTFYMRKRGFYRSINRSKIFVYLRRIFIIINNEINQDKVDLYTYKYVVVNIFLFISSFVIVFICNYRNHSLCVTLLLGLFFSFLLILLPFAVLRLRLQILQAKSSHEAMIIVSEISNQYKIYNKNIMEAIDKTILNLPPEIFSKKILLRLSMELKQYRNDDELVEIIKRFSYAIGTSWANMLANSIYVAISDKFDISSSLEGILKHISIIENNIRYGKKLTNEGFILAKYFAPILYLIMLIVMNKMLSIKITDILIYQFRGEGLEFFIVMVIVFILCMLEEYLYKNKKFDL